MPKKDAFGFLFNDRVAKADPFVADLIAAEDERQARQIILIPSESICAWAVRRVLDCSFTNLYAEGYPATENTLMSSEELTDVPLRLAGYRRYGDRRFYKGNAYVNLIESICRRRAAECFATKKTPASSIFANVQPLSGAAANLAVYEAFVPLGGTVMALSLMEGGHLSHGSKFHMTGKRYYIVPYCVDPKTELLDYDAILALAKEAKPKMIIAGYTSYPWAPDFAKFRAIADEVGAILMADIAHPAGLVIAGAYPNPIDHCDVVTFTTHKTLMGPRAAVILTRTEEKAKKIDMAVFPGEQGGPHMNTIAALAVAFKLAQTKEFKKLQHQIVANAKAMADEFQKLGLRVAYGGTDTHKLLIDLKPLGKKNGTLLYGEPAAQILEQAGIILNKNTIPGDKETPLATGLRLGTPWITQRGAGEPEARIVAQLIHRVLVAIEPFQYDGQTRPLPRGRIDLSVLREVSEAVEAFCAGLSVKAEQRSGYPHHPYLDQPNDCELFKILGPKAKTFLNDVAAADFSDLGDDEIRPTVILDGEGRVVDHVVVTKLPTRGDPRRDGYLVKANAAHLADLLTWLRALADGYVKFEPLDVTAKIEGPVIIEQLDPTCEFANEWTGKMPAPAAPADVDLARPYFIGQSALSKAAAPPAKTPFVWQEPETPVKRTTLYDQHVKLGAKIVPFAGHEMPVRYGSTIEEHQAVRTAAGLFDVSHMGVFDASGPYAEGFVELVSGNYIGGMQVGDSIYDHLFDHAANLLDDLLVYRFEAERYLLVVNAANEAKDWAWLTAVNEGRALLDPEVPHRAVNRPAVLRNLKDPRWGDERRVDLALQGQKSRDILLKIADDVTQAMLRKLGRTKCAYGKLAGLEVAISRTGYTGEPISFELFVHPDRAPVLWNAILDAGRDLGVKPIGLGARDSLRLEAGLPLYGHELEGPFGIMPCDAGFGAYVKLHKPFFVGKNAYRRRTAKRERIIVRFIVPAKGSRPLKTGDPIIDDKGACFGHVTSCATDGQGLLIGQAFVQTGRHKPGPILIVPSGGKKAADELRVGDRVTMPVQAEIIKRWPSR